MTSGIFTFPICLDYLLSWCNIDINVVCNSTQTFRLIVWSLLLCPCQDQTLSHDLSLCVGFDLQLMNVTPLLWCFEIKDQWRITSTNTQTCLENFECVINGFGFKLPCFKPAVLSSEWTEQGFIWCFINFRLRSVHTYKICFLSHSFPASSHVWFDPNLSALPSLFDSHVPWYHENWTNRRSEGHLLPLGRLVEVIGVIEWSLAIPSFVWKMDHLIESDLRQAQKVNVHEYHHCHQNPITLWRSPRRN